jgi:molybdate transport system substrate-binding protein
MIRVVLLLSSIAWLGAGAAAGAETATVAVAANFSAPLEALAEQFERDTGDEITIAAGSTGQLYAQITNGAPFDVFLAADQRRPELLAREKLGDPRTRFTYAVGRLVLWTRRVDEFPDLSLDVLRTDDFRWLAIANPRLAPYGAAARQALESLGLWDSLQPRIVQGQNIAQAFAMAESRSADLGLVALSQAVAYPGRAAYVRVPTGLYDPIRQDAILLEHGRANPAAAAFMQFLAGPEAAAVITEFGYSLPGPGGGP